MNPSLDELGITRLSMEERLILIGAIWDSITDSANQPEIPQWHINILEERLSSADKTPENYISWDELKADLDQK